MSNPSTQSTDPVIQLHATLLDIEQATNHPPKRLTERQILALDKKWYVTLKTLTATPATTPEGRKVKAELFLRSLQQFGARADDDAMTEAELIALSIISDVVGPAEVARLTAMTASASA